MYRLLQTLQIKLLLDSLVYQILIPSGSGLPPQTVTFEKHILTDKQAFFTQPDQLFLMTRRDFLFKEISQRAMARCKLDGQ